MRKPSPETEVRNLRRELSRANEELRSLRLIAGREQARGVKAEAECAEWKRRFDLLLARTPEASR